MKKRIAEILILILMIIGGCAVACTVIVACDINVEEPAPIEEVTMTVDEFVSLPGDFYYIVKAEGDWGVLESDVYMDREVVEVAVCEDTENTICLFIQLEENEEPHYRKN